MIALIAFVGWPSFFFRLSLTVPPKNVIMSDSVLQEEV